MKVFDDREMVNGQLKVNALISYNSRKDISTDGRNSDLVIPEIWGMVRKT